MAIEHAVHTILATVLKKPSSLHALGEMSIKRRRKEGPPKDLIASYQGTGLKRMKTRRAQVLLLCLFLQQNHCRTICTFIKFIFS
jgi:hypothetical protein